jgi:hypothetical protein
MSAIRRNKDIVERSNIEQPSLEWAQLSLFSPSRLNLKEYNKLKKWSKDINLPVMSHSKKANIPLKGTIRKHQMIYCISILNMSNAI